MCFAASNLSAEPLAKEVCDRLLKKGLLNANPAYVHKVREAELAEIFEEANLDGRTLPLIGGSRRLEVHLLSVTAGEACAWLDHVISELTEMVQDGAFQVRSGRGEVQPRTLGNKAVLTAVEGTRRLELLGSEDLASWVCDRLVERGLLKAENTRERHDREVGISSLLQRAHVDGEALAGFHDQRSLEQHLLCITGNTASVHLERAISDLADMLLELASAEQVELSQGNDDFDEVDPAPMQKLPVVKGEHTGAGVVDTPRSMAFCSTCDCIEEMPAQKRVSFSAAPPEVSHVVPYSEVYILHPDKFDFDSEGRYITDDESIDANLRSTVRPA